MCTVRSPVKELELLQRPNVDGVFLVIVTQIYATLNDLLLQHKHLQYALSCLLRQFSSGKSLWEISNQRLCQVTRMFLIDPGVNCMRVFHLEAFRFLTERGSEEGSLIQLNAAVYGLVDVPYACRKTIVRGIEDLVYKRS